MNKKDYLILTKGRALCLVLDTAIGLLNEMELISSVNAYALEWAGLIHTMGNLRAVG